MERYAVVKAADNIVFTIVAVAPGQAWHCNDGCFSVLLTDGEDCDMGWTFVVGASPRFTFTSSGQ